MQIVKLVNVSRKNCKIQSHWTNSVEPCIRTSNTFPFGWFRFCKNSVNSPCMTFFYHDSHPLALRFDNPTNVPVTLSRTIWTQHRIHATPDRPVALVPIACKFTVIIIDLNIKNQWSNMYQSLVYIWQWCEILSENLWSFRQYFAATVTENKQCGFRLHLQ